MPPAKLEIDARLAALHRRCIHHAGGAGEQRHKVNDFDVKAIENSAKACKV
jgi:hypothetical protein